MSLYEHVFIARQDISAQRVDTLIKTFGDIIADRGGRVGKKEYWGLRTLAYQIRKNKRGHYALMNLEAPHEAITEMERRMSLHEDVLRFLTMRVEKHDDSPSPPMQKAQADEERRTARSKAPRVEVEDTETSETSETPETAAKEDTQDAEAETEAEAETDTNTDTDTGTGTDTDTDTDDA